MYVCKELYCYNHRLVILIVTYFVAGMIIMRVKYEKTGSDIIPNKEFWMALPFFVKVILSTYLN